VTINDAGQLVITTPQALGTPTITSSAGSTSGINLGRTRATADVEIDVSGSRSMTHRPTDILFFHDLVAVAGSAHINAQAGTFNDVAFAPDRSDLNSGLYSAGPDDVRLSAGGVSGLGQTATESTLYVEQVISPFARTCTDSGDINPGTLAAAVSGASKIEITNNDPHGCTVTLSESGATRGQTLIAIVIATAGGTVDFPDTAGVQETGLGCSLGINGVAVFHYATTDRWIKQGCEASN
jgi:hypothetical protein